MTKQEWTNFLSQPKTCDQCGVTWNDCLEDHPFSECSAPVEFKLQEANQLIALLTEEVRQYMADHGRRNNDTSEVLRKAYRFLNRR